MIAGLSSGAVLALIAAGLVGATVHAALGFGSGPVLASVLVLVLGPGPVAVAVVLWAGLALSLLVLGAERRRPRPDAMRLRVTWLAAGPGAAAGAAAAAGLPRAVLQVALAAVLAVCAVAALTGGERTEPALARLLSGGPGARAVTGVVLGACAALTGIIGPLVALLLVPLGLVGDRLRDSIAATFLVVTTAALAAQLAVLGPGPSLEAARPLAVLAVPLLAGHAAGRRLFRGPLAHAGRQRAVSLAGIAGGAVLAAASLVV